MISYTSHFIAYCYMISFTWSYMINVYEKSHIILDIKVALNVYEQSHIMLDIKVILNVYEQSHIMSDIKITYNIYEPSKAWPSGKDLAS